MNRDMHSTHRLARSIEPAAYTNNDTTTNGAWVNVADVASIEAFMTFDDTTDVLAAALNWEAWVEKAKDDGSGAADASTALDLTEEQYLGASTELATPADGTGICFLDAPAEDDKEFRVGVRALGGGYEWVRINLRGNGNHVDGSVAFGGFIFTPQSRPVANP